MQFDFALSTWDEGSSTVRIEFRRGKVQRPTKRNPGAPWNSGTTVGVIEVVYWRSPTGDGVGLPREVRLNLDGLTASAIARFAWTRWLAAADACARTKGKDFGPIGAALRAETAVEKQRAKRRARRPPPKRPGRAGHGESFYKEIAERVLYLRAHGVEAPASVLADERGVSPNTARGWAKRARDLELLPPARRGRAG